MRPLAKPVKGGKREIRRRAARPACVDEAAPARRRPANKFRAASHVIHHPCRQPRVIRISPHFADMTGQRRDKVADIFNGRFDEQIGIRHLPPKFRFDDVAFKIGGQGFEGVQNQKMRANVRAMAVALVREKNHARLLFRQNFGDDFDCRPPRRAIFLVRNRIDIFPIRHRKAKAEEIARGPQFTQALRAPRFFAAECHDDVDDVPLRFTQQPQRQPANEALVVRVRRENQCFRRGGRHLWTPG